MSYGEEKLRVGWPIFEAEWLEGDKNAGGAATPR